jgi:single-strand DNA-binding protein
MEAGRYHSVDRMLFDGPGSHLGDHTGANDRLGSAMRNRISRNSTKAHQQMAADNHTTIVGNLVEGPPGPRHQHRHRRHQPPRRRHQRIQHDGQWRDGDTSFFKVNVWRGQAEHLADSLSKGDRVMVTGRLRQRSWETPEGDKRSVTELEADEVGASLDAPPTY